MALKVTCPSCQTSYQLADSVAGQKVRCKSCQQVFRVAGGDGPRFSSESSRKIETGIRKDRAPTLPARRPRDEVEDDRLQPARRSRGEETRANPWPWVVGGVALAMLLLVMGIAGIIMLGKSASNKDTPGGTAPVAAVNAAVPTTPAATIKPLPLPPVAASAGTLVEPGGKDDSIPLATLQAIKDATVYIKVEAAQGQGSGSGFVMSAQGDTALVVTNQHVANPKFKYEGPAPRSPRSPRFGPPVFVRPQVIKAKEVKVTAVFGSGTPREHAHAAEVLAADEEHDLAILKVTGVPNLPAPIDFSHEVKLVETMPIYSFGFPFGQALSVSKGQHPAITVGRGSVSSIRLDDQGDLAVVQIDGALNPGSSGGPIVDTRGHLVGVAVAIIKDANNIGFAVPSRQLTQLVRGGVGAVEMKVVKTDQQSLEVQFTAPVIDLWQRINGATLYYRTGLPAPGQQKDAFANLPDTQEVPLKLEHGKATARFTLPLQGRPVVDVVCQVALGDNEGKTILAGMTLHTLRNALGEVVPPGTPSPVAAAAPAGPAPAGWKEYSPRDHSYTCWIPDRPARRGEHERTMTSRGMRMKLTTLEWEPPGGPKFEAAAVAMSALAARQVPRGQMVDIFRDAYVESAKGKVLDEKTIQQGRLNGKEIVVQTGVGLSRLRVFTSGTRVFLVSVAGTQEQAQSADGATFLESFRLPDRPVAAAPDPANPGRPSAGSPRSGRPSRLNAATGETEVMGGTFDKAFRDEAPGGGLLIGFEVGLGKFGSNDVIRAVRPVFRTADGKEEVGKQHGTQLERVVTVKAKAGYAVGAIIGKVGLTMDGFSVIFMAAGPDGLDVNKSYTSDWIGGKGGGAETQLGGTGSPVIGILGKENAKDCTGLGLLLKPSDGGAAAKDAGG